MKYFLILLLALSFILMYPMSNAHAVLNDAPTTTVGPSIDCIEKGNGIIVTASLAGTVPVATNPFEFLLNGNSFPTPISGTLTALEVANLEVTRTISSDQLGNNGAKIITFQGTLGIEGLLTSPELILTLACSSTSSASVSFNEKMHLFSLLNPALNFAQTNGFVDNVENFNIKSKIPTKYIKIGEPLTVSLQFPENLSQHLQKVHLYMNLRGMAHDIQHSDTYIQYDKFRGPLIVDPRGYFSNVDIKEEIENGIRTYVFSIKFDKTMEKSNLIVQYIDAVNNYQRTVYKDALQVVDADFTPPNNVENTLTSLKSKLDTSVNKVSKVSRYDKILQDNLAFGTVAPVYEKVTKLLELDKIPIKLEVPIEFSAIQKSNIRMELGTIKALQIDTLNQLSANNFEKIPYEIFRLASSDNAEESAEKYGLLYKDGIIKIIANIPQNEISNLQQLNKFGQIDFVSSNYVQMNLELDKLSEFVDANEVDDILIPKKPVQSSSAISSKEFVNADWLDITGITGDGVKVAVIDYAFDLFNPKLASNIEKAKSFRYNIDGTKSPATSGLGSEEIHGTSVAEVIVDIAPGADLFLYAINNDLEFSMALTDIVENDVDVVVIPLAWTDWPTDGTSLASDFVSDVIKEDIPVVISAGNYGQKHWEGTFSDENNNGWNEFADIDEGLTFTVTQDRIEQNIPLHFNMLWNSDTVADLDMVFLDPTNELVEFSTDIQNNSDDFSYERIIHYPTKEGSYLLGVIRDGHVDDDIPVEIFSINDNLEHAVSTGSVTVPTDAQNAIVVGAVNSKSGEIKPYSSLGPTNNGHMVPQVLAPDETQTISNENKPFTGTSSSAPYVAGIIALALEVDPNMSIEEILQNIENMPTQSSEICVDLDYCRIIDADQFIPWEKFR